MIDFGDAVEILPDAPDEFFSHGSAGSVCGLTIVSSEAQRVKYKKTLGTRVFLVEFSDGSSLEIPEQFLKKMA